MKVQMVDKFKKPNNRLDSNRKIERFLKKFRVQLILRGTKKIFEEIFFLNVGNFPRGSFYTLLILNRLLDIDNVDESLNGR